GGRIPDAGVTVRIAEGSRVEYDVVSDVRLHAVGVAGTLAFRTSEDTRLRVTHLLVYTGGTLSVGDERSPVQPAVLAEIVINDDPLLTGTVSEPDIDPFQHGNGLLVWGTLMLHGAPRSPGFVRLASEARRGDTELVASAPLSGWQTGDTLLLPDSRLPSGSEIQPIHERQYKREEPRSAAPDPAWETVRIASIAGSRVALAAPLRFDHLSARDAAGSVARGIRGVLLVPHVANVTRNVVVRSENPEGIRGHTIAFRDASVVIANASFRGLGRTTAAPLDNTRTDADGRVVHIGTNQAARYPVHMHHLVDAGRLEGTADAFQITGSVIDNARRWGISIHGSHFGLVSDTVVFDVVGAGIVTEDGSETGNRFERNFVAAVHGSGEAIDARRSAGGMGHEGAGFWLGSDNNTVVDNVVAGVRDGGFTLFRTPEALAFPAFPHRAEIAEPDQSPRAVEFSGNEVYGAARTGIELWDSKACDLCGASDTILSDTTIWHSRNGVTFDYHADHHVIDGLHVHGDPGRLEDTTGITANASRRAAIRRADIRYVDVGLDGGGRRTRLLEIDQMSVLARVGILLRRGNSWTQRAATFQNVSITSLAGPGARLVELDPRPFGRDVSAMLHRPIHFIGFQGRPGSDFQLFFDDQAPDRVVLQDKVAVRGCPEAGLTNAQCFSAHGIATGGEVASCATRIEGIDGFACPPTQNRLVNR
ncbi:MAG: G8 domain-containing protein, partial [Vicinamibacterales bacterium]